MKTLGVLLPILLTACAAVPVQTEEATRQLQERRDQELLALDMPPGTSSYIRVGVEYLPPTEGSRLPVTALETPEIATPVPPPSEPGFGPTEPRPTERPKARLDELQMRWSLQKHDIRRIRNPIERMTMRFLSELVGDDRKRVERSIGASLLGANLRLSTDPMSNFLDERDREDHQRLLTENGTRMIRRPLRNAIKELPLFQDVEYAIHEFKESNRKYTDRKSEGLGRVSIRIRGGDFTDPVELRWMRNGFRISSTLSYLKTAFAADLTDRLRFTVRYKYDYTDTDWRLSGNLEYELNDFTTFHVLAGNRINIVGPFTFPGGPQDEDASTGVLCFFHHQF